MCTDFRIQSILPNFCVSDKGERGKLAKIHKKLKLSVVKPRFRRLYSTSKPLGDGKRRFISELQLMAVPHRRQNADDEQHAADERGQSAAKFHSCADAVADKKQHERQQIHEHGKAEHLPGLALEQHAVADGRMRVIFCIS